MVKTFRRLSFTSVDDLYFHLVKELKIQSAALEFEISLKAVSVLRYITDHTDRYVAGFNDKNFT